MKTKKVLGAIGAVILFGGLLIILMRTSLLDLNKTGADIYYTKITGAGEQIEDKADNSGETYIRYAYKLPAYDKNGDEKELEFTAGKQLREGAYLKVYYKESKGVTSYEEVTKKKLPDKAGEALQ